MSKLYKRPLGVLIIMCIVFGFLVACSNEEETGIVAKIDGETISQEEFEADFEFAKKVRIEKYGEDLLSQDMGNDKSYEDVLKEELLEAMILEKLIAKELNDMDIYISDEEVNRVLEERYIAEMGGEEQFKDYLDGSQISQESFIKDLRRILTFESHRENFFNKTHIGDEDAQDYFMENKDFFIKVRASHILTKTEKEGKQVLDRIKEGEDFHSLLAKGTIDDKITIQGGDLGYFTRKSLLEGYKALGDAAFDLNVGEFSKLVRTEFGYHIIFLEDRVDTFEELKDEVVLALKYKKHNEEIASLREKADIKIINETFTD